MAFYLLRLCALLAVICCVALANPIDPLAQTGPESEAPVTSFAVDVASSTPGAEVTSSTEGSKMSRFLDDFTSAFKQGTAKMKESLESAATSVKDGVLQGYDYVRSKLTGAAVSEGPVAASGEPTEASPTVAALTSTAAFDGAAPAEHPTATSTAAADAPAPSNERPATGAAPAAGSSFPSYGGTVGVSHEPAKIVPNDDDDDERIIFNDKDYLAEKTPEGEDERDVTETPAVTGVTLDNRFILASPLACKSGQEAVNGKCRNVF